ESEVTHAGVVRLGCLSAALQLKTDHVNLARVHVLEGVRRKCAAPDRRAWLREGAAVACVDKEHSIGIPAHAVAEREDVEDRWPTMCVDLGRVAGCDPGFQDADGVVLEEKPV